MGKVADFPKKCTANRWWGVSRTILMIFFLNMSVPYLSNQKNYQVTICHLAIAVKGSLTFLYSRNISVIYEKLAMYWLLVEIFRMVVAFSSPLRIFITKSFASSRGGGEKSSPGEVVSNCLISPELATVVYRVLHVGV